MFVSLSLHVLGSQSDLPVGMILIVLNISQGNLKHSVLEQAFSSLQCQDEELSPKSDGQQYAPIQETDHAASSQELGQLVLQKMVVGVLLAACWHPWSGCV